MFEGAANTVQGSVLPYTADGKYKYVVRNLMDYQSGVITTTGPKGNQNISSAVIAVYDVNRRTAMLNQCFSCSPSSQPKINLIRVHAFSILVQLRVHSKFVCVGSYQAVSLY